MKYYLIVDDGAYIEEEEYPKGWFRKDSDWVFTNRREAVKEARKRLKERIAELKLALKELK